MLKKKLKLIANKINKETPQFEKSVYASVYGSKLSNMERMIPSTLYIQSQEKKFINFSLQRGHPGQSDKLDHIFPCPNGKATRLGRSDCLSFLPCPHYLLVLSRKFEALKTEQ